MYPYFVIKLPDERKQQADIFKNPERNDRLRTSGHVLYAAQDEVHNLYGEGRELYNVTTESDAIELGKVLAQKYPSNKYATVTVTNICNAVFKEINVSTFDPKVGLLPT